jgi:hypothetical protein
MFLALPPFPSACPCCCSLLPTGRQGTSCLCHATRSVPCCPPLYV